MSISNGVECEQEEKKLLIAPVCLSEDYKEPQNCCVSFLHLVKKSITQCIWKKRELEENEPVWQPLLQKNEEQLFLNMPREMCWYLAKYLDIKSIVSLSKVNRLLFATYGDEFWRTYSNKLPRALSRWGTVTMEEGRNNFLAHLLYMSGEIAMAARLKHPEALLYKKYLIMLPQNRYLSYENIVRDEHDCRDEVLTVSVMDAIERDEAQRRAMRINSRSCSYHQYRFRHKDRFLTKIMLRKANFGPH